MQDPPLLFVRGLSGLAPDNSAAMRALDEFKPGDTVRIRISKPRNRKHAAKYWVLCNKVAEAIGPTISAELVSDTIKLRTGHVIIWRTADGRENTKPGSIAFDKMDQAEFAKFYERAIHIIATSFLPGMAESDLRREIEELVSS